MAARTAAIAAATAVAADARPRVTVAGVLLRAMAVAAGIRRRAEVPRAVAVGRRRTAVDRRRVVAADMGGDTALDSFPA